MYFCKILGGEDYKTVTGKSKNSVFVRLVLQNQHRAFSSARDS